MGCNIVDLMKTKPKLFQKLELANGMLLQSLEV